MQKTMASAAVMFILASGALCACSDNGEKSLGTDNPVDTTLSLEDFAATWEGYIEAYEMPSGSDQIRIVLDAEGQGTVQFGTGEVLPPPTDPDTGYPPAGLKPSNDGLYEQFAYPVYEPQLDATRLRLKIDVLYPYKDWCALQTPIHDEVEDVYRCVPRAPLTNTNSPEGCYYSPGGDPESGERVPIDCAKIDLCIGMCMCTQNSCAITEPNPVKIDGALSDDGKTFEGTIALMDNYTIRLTRQ
jgi:hypothetical protein